MSSFYCPQCGALCSDSPRGYITGCEHYPSVDVSPQDIPLNPPSQAKGKIMECEDCGRVDHHCIAGLCASCRVKYSPRTLAQEIATYATLRIRGRKDSRRRPSLPRETTA